MKKGTYYIENTVMLDHILSVLKELIPCFVEREYIEMNYSEITVTARAEDFPTVENYLAPLV